MFVILMFLAILGLACIASAGLILATEDLSIAQTVGEDTAIAPRTPAS